MLNWDEGLISGYAQQIGAYIFIVLNSLTMNVTNLQASFNPKLEMPRTKVVPEGRYEFLRDDLNMEGDQEAFILSKPWMLYVGTIVRKRKYN